MRNSRKLLRNFLRPEFSLGAEEDYLGPSLPLRAATELHGSEQRPGHKYHAFTATVGAIIHRTMPIGGKVAQINHPHFKELRLQRAPDDPALQYARKQLRENGDDIKSHSLIPRKIAITKDIAIISSVIRIDEKQS